MCSLFLIDIYIRTDYTLNQHIGANPGFHKKFHKKGGGGANSMWAKFSNTNVKFEASKGVGVSRGKLEI